MSEIKYPEVVIIDGAGNEVFRKEEREFIRAEIRKSRRLNEGIVNLFSLELELKGDPVLEKYSDLESGQIKFVDNEKNLERTLEIEDLDEYKVYFSRAGKMIEVLNIAGNII